MYGLILNIHASQSEMGNMKMELRQLKTRLDAIEAKVGGVDEVAERLG